MNEIDVIEILTKYPDCKTNGGKFRAILMDLYPNASKAIVNTFVLMSDCGIVEEIFSAKQIDSFYESRWKKKLEDDYGISDKIICECLSFMTESDAKQLPSINDADVKNQVDVGSTKPIDTVSKMPKPSQLSDFEIENGVLKRYEGSASSVVIPDSVTSIGDRAFYRCSGLTDITIPDSVMSIGWDAFGNCMGLTTIYYTGDVTKWCGINGLNNLMSRSRTLYIGGNKVEGELIIPDSVMSIPSYAFYGCTGLTSVTIPESVTSIGEWAFLDCTKLTTIYYTGDVAGWYEINRLGNLMSDSRMLYIENDTTQYVFHYQLGYGKIISKDKLIKVVFDSCPYKTMLFRENEICDGKNVYLVSQQEYYNNHDKNADHYSAENIYKYDNPTPYSVRRKTDARYISNHGYDYTEEFNDYDALIDSGDLGMDYEDYDEEY